MPRFLVVEAVCLRREWEISAKNEAEAEKMYKEGEVVYEDDVDAWPCEIKEVEE